MSRRPGAGAVAQDTTELVALVVTVDDGMPAALASGDPRRLPAGPLHPQQRSLQAGVRAFVEEQTGHSLGFVEQLYTFADLGRGDSEGRVVSISYLGLTRAATDEQGWLGLYDALPWEDRRGAAAEPGSADGSAGSPGSPGSAEPVARLDRWVGRGSGAQVRARRERRDQLFGLGEHAWRPELALQRYELLWEAGLVAESPQFGPRSVQEPLGVPMLHDHRRILATGLSRLRTKLQYRPVVFELLPEAFTLGRLQEVVEALAGQTLHKQNFRRVVEQQHQLVEPTGETTHATGGRPARLYRFRREVFAEREQVGTKLPIPRSR
ncbi:hypothetical protein [Barrientosiimonas humi]|uniref:NUDIX hydrolase n=1 Tax=Barrientosiimonas humi TaxID=999931 RepID=UPI00370DA5EA